MRDGTAINAWTHEPVILDETVDGARRIGGLAFRPKRTSPHRIDTLRSPCPDFVEGLRMSMERRSGATGRQMSEDHGYAKGWVSDLIYDLERGKGTTIEFVVMLRESNPWLDHQMAAGMVPWPKLATFGDYEEQRPGVQTTERIEAQAIRRAG